MTPELETAVENAAKIITEQPGSAYTIEQARVLACNVMEAAGVNFQAPAREPTPAPGPATPPPMPRYDPKTDVFAYGRELAKWNTEVQTSYHPPINENVERARARLVELRNVSDNESAALKVQRALEREKLIEIIYGQNGGARL